MADRRVAGTGRGRPLSPTVLLVNDVASVGGGQTVMLQVLQVLLDAGFRAHVACPAGDLADRSEELGASWHPFAFTERRLLTAGRRLPRPQALAARVGEGRALAALAAEVGAGVVHTGALVPHVDTQAGGRRLRAKTLWHVNQVSPPYLFAGPLPARIVGVSRAALQPAAWRPGAVARSAVVPNGIDVERFRPPSAAERALARKELGLEEELTIMTVARLEPLKGVDGVIRAAAASGVSPTLVVVGDATGYSGGDEHAQGLRKLAADVGLDVRFLGSRPDVARLLWAADLFVFMSRWEAFGLVLAEASAAGLPVIASDTGGCAEVVVDGVTGLLVAPDDVPGCAAAIAGLASDKGRRGQLGAAGRRHALEHFDLATFGSRMLPQYLRLVGNAVTTVGVTMSVYNGAATLAQALASVAGQTRRPEQVVVVDDGSTDGTLAAAQAWEGVLPLRVVRHQMNSGVAVGRTTAMAEVDTDLVLALDADDAWLPHHLHRLLDAYQARPGIVSPMAVAWEPGEARPVDWTSRRQALPKSPDIEHLLIMNWVFSGSLFERKAFVAAGNIYRYPGCEDWDLWLRLMRMGVPVTVLHEPTVLYRVHAGSISAEDRMLPTEIEVLEGFLNETSAPQLRAAARRSLRHRHARLALRAAYEQARAGRGTAARRVAMRSLRGPGPVRLRGAAMVVAPAQTVRRRDLVHRVPGQ